MKDNNETSLHLLLKKAVIFTDDSGVKLPEIYRWRSVLGKGRDINKNPQILEILKKANFDIPRDNIDLEDNYRIILKEFVRPAKQMFAGMFGEIRIFYDLLREILPTELYIVSGRYGLIKEDKEIIPYSVHIETVDDLKKLDNRTCFLKAMFKAIKDKRFIIMCFPSHYFKYLINEGWFEEIGNDNRFFIVTGVHIMSGLSSYPNMKLYEKRGVARIGKDYQMKIIELIKFEIK